MAQTYKAPNGRLCVIVDGAKPANPHTLIDDPKHAGNHGVQSLTEQKLKAEHVIVNYVNADGAVLGSEEVRLDSLTPAT